MYTKDQVAHLVDHLNDAKFEPAPEIETGQFGLSAHLFDPVSGQIITLAQPHRVDVGQPEILLTPTQAAQAVIAVRATHLHNVRAAGYASIEAYNEAQKHAVAARDLAHKQGLERAKLDEEQAAAKSAAVAEAMPVKDQNKATLQQREEADRQESMRRGGGWQPTRQEDELRRDGHHDGLLNEEMRREPKQQGQPLQQTQEGEQNPGNPNAPHQRVPEPLFTPVD